MAILYEVKAKKNPLKPAEPPKFYAQIARASTLTTKQLAEEIAAASTVSRADVQAVLRLRQPSPARTVGVWAKALRDSSRSAACTQFREHVEHFLRSSAAAVWGPSIDADRLVARFLAQARRAG